MLRTDSYTLAPGACFVCGTSNGPAVDTEVSTEGLHLDGDHGHEHWVGMEGRVYLCASCVAEAAALLGDQTSLEPAGRSGELAERVAELEDQLAEATAAADAAREMSAAMVKAGYFEVNADTWDVLDEATQVAVLPALTRTLDEQPKAKPKPRARARTKEPVA